MIKLTTVINKFYIRSVFTRCDIKLYSFNRMQWPTFSFYRLCIDNILVQCRKKYIGFKINQNVWIVPIIGITK